MPKGDRHLTRDQRCQIAVLKARGVLQKDIAKALNISATTISRELKRNSNNKGQYDYHYADVHARIRRASASRKAKRITTELLAVVEEHLKEGWSPEQISGRLKLKDILISHQKIYQHIWADRKTRSGTLFTYLRHKGKKYKKRLTGKYKGKIPNRMDIADRPEIVELKSRIGDWEGDTIVGPGHRGAILSYVERKSKLTVLSKLKRKTAANVVEATTKSLGKLPSSSLLTITLDNGPEFSSHMEITNKIGAKCYFARPYHAWERGLNEHTNGLVRKYFSKSTDLLSVSEQEIKKVEELLNNRPRKILGYRTPKEVFVGSTPKIAIQC